MYTKTTKKLLEQTLKNLPHKSETKNIRDYISKALNEIKIIENKKENKKQISVRERWHLDANTGSLQNLSLPNFKNIMSTIENMISKEKNKLSQDANFNNDDNLIND